MCLGSGSIWDPGSMSAEGRLLSRPKADFKGVVWPWTPQGRGGGGSPPKKELFATAKSGTVGPSYSVGHQTSHAYPNEISGDHEKREQSH